MSCLYNDAVVLGAFEATAVLKICGGLRVLHHDALAELLDAVSRQALPPVVQSAVIVIVRNSHKAWRILQGKHFSAL